MFKLILLGFLNPAFANDLEKRSIVKEIKKKICKCQTPREEIDFELFHEPYLRDSLQLFALEKSNSMGRYFEFAKIKVVYRIKF